MIVRGAALELVASVEGPSLIRGVFSERLPSPIGKSIERFVIIREAGEIEGQLASNDQLFEKLVSDQLVAAGIVLDRQSHLERRDVPEMQIGTEPGSRFRRWLIMRA